MIVIGEKINSKTAAVKVAIDSRDSRYIQELAKKQYEEGATYIDVNAGAFEDEPERLEWLINTIQDVVDAPFSIDSQNANAIEKALKLNKNPKPIINSITGEKERFNSVLPLVVEYNASVIALCMDDTGMPETMEERLSITDNLILSLTKEGVKLDDIYIDPFVRPVGTGIHNGSIALETFTKIRSEFPGVHITCGISNISFGIPARKLMNQAFLVAAMVSGADTVILDPLDKKLMSLLYATETLTGNDEFCMNYQMKFREGMLDF
ncbi:methyltetrahydrofolate--corrinoid methyltransferase [Acetivibrio cellulolyticus]|uniref:methyltetrahydrofolate--corrinoid methyltransferase n=1 Tax=Acetivibrio cellulolyticus TaxID=35830 RepID=UPI0001E305C1|nr:methyltetrahydrofolate--corrinoid methyltransferase [Acetivibrio cellulolyticus]